MVKSNRTCFCYVLYSDKTQVFDQSEHTQGPIYITTIDTAVNTLSLNFSHGVIGMAGRIGQFLHCIDMSIYVVSMPDNIVHHNS